jgi:hypothetical protein
MLWFFAFPAERIVAVQGRWTQPEWTAAVRAAVKRARKTQRTPQALKPRARPGVTRTGRRPNHAEMSEPFGLAREEDSWKDSLRGTLAGLVIGMPWTVLFAVRYDHSGAGNNTYDALYFLSDELTVLGGWALLGYLFGYGFPLIRGTNGISKGFTLMPTLLVPPIPLLFLWGTHGDVVSYGLYSLESLTFFLILGVVIGNVGLLYRAGLDIWDASDLYRIRGLVTWGTTSVAAIATACATAIGTAASGAVTAQLAPSTTTNQAPQQPTDQTK